MDRQVLENRIEESERRFRELFNHMSSGVAIYEAVNDGEDFVFKDFNRAAEQIDGFKKEDLVGRRVLEAFPGIRAFGLFDIMQAVWKSGEPEYHPTAHYEDNRVQGWRENYVYKLPSGELVAVYDDVTARKEAEESLRKSYDQLRRTLMSTVDALTAAVEMRDPYTAGHQHRVPALAQAIAGEMGLAEEKILGLRVASLVHDIGKINVPAEILSKPGLLAAAEYELVKVHPQIGYNVLKGIEFPWPVAEIVHQHHERIDGSGYPRGLTGEQMLLEAKILAVADTVEAMVTHRPYRTARGIDEALGEISKNRGVLYDPETVDACLCVFRERGFKLEEKA